MFVFFIFPWLDGRRGPMSPYCRGFEVSRSHSDTPYSAIFLWTSDRLFAETSTWQHTTLTRDRQPCFRGGFEPEIPASERPQACTIERVTIDIGFEILTQYYFVPPFLSFSFYDFIHTAFSLYLTRYYSCCLPCLSIGINIAKTNNSTLYLVSSLVYCWWQAINNV